MTICPMPVHSTALPGMEARPMRNVVVAYNLYTHPQWYGGSPTWLLPATCTHQCFMSQNTPRSQRSQRSFQTTSSPCHRYMPLYHTEHLVVSSSVTQYPQHSKQALSCCISTNKLSTQSMSRHKPQRAPGVCGLLSMPCYAAAACDHRSLHDTQL